MNKLQLLEFKKEILIIYIFIIEIHHENFTYNIS